MTVRTDEPAPPAPAPTETPAPESAAAELCQGSLSQGLYSWWCRAAEPKSQRIGSPPRGRRVKRAFLSRAHSPMCVLVT